VSPTSPPSEAAGSVEPGDAPVEVRVLPEALANQIAAGEVVERPASVVKELVENALDAGATRVLIDIDGAGKGLIRIVDDGSGMSSESAALAVLRHATSKVRTASDLEAIGTLGFRGEALPSIASVSRFLLVTRAADAEVATTVRIEGGGTPELGVAAAPVGTRIEVRDLFWNVPARLKFLKTDTTETQHVIELVKGFALGHPRVHFRLGTGGRAPALDFPAVRRLAERVSQVLGREAAERLYEVNEPGPPVRVTGFVSGPRSAKATPSAMTCFVNGRRVRDRVLHHAAISAFGAELSAGRFPQAILWVHLDPADVDVNVHPAKAEVRFRQPDQVHVAVAAAIQGMLRARPWADDEPLPLEEAARRLDEPGPTARPSARAPSQIPLVGATPRMASPEAAYEARPRPQASSLPQRVSLPAPHATSLRLGERPRALFDERPQREPTQAPIVRPSNTATAATSQPSTSSGARGPDVSRGLKPSITALHTIGSTRNRSGLIVCEDDLGLVLVDVTSAVELMTMARILALPDPAPPQPLLIPARLDLAPHEAEALRPRLPDLQSLGLWVEPFGGQTFQLLGLPAPALRASPSRVLAAVAGLLTRDREAQRPALAQAVGAALASSAESHALVGLVAPSMDAFVAEAVTLSGKDHRGRRPFVRLPESEISRRFEGG